jgi:hypothetical protein
MDEMLDRLEGEVAAARAAYFAERSALQSLLVPLFRDPADACDNVVSVADEFGVERAVEEFRRPYVYGAFTDAAIEIDPELNAALGQQVERLMDAQERLDATTARREDHLQTREPGHVRVINFDGREFAVDATGRELRSVESAGERYAMPDIALPVQGPEPSLTEHVGGDVPAAQPSPERGIERQR